MIILPDCDRLIKFRVFLGWLVGVRRLATYSYGATTTFFVSSEIKENKHWGTFTEKEILEWEYL